MIIMCSNLLKNFSRFTEFLRPNSAYNVIVNRGIKQWVRPYLFSLYKRRLDQGPEPDRPRSAWLNWNYDVEIYSFGKRLGEDFQSNTLKTAFTNRSYVEEEKQKREKLGVEDNLAQLQLTDNEEFQQTGEAIARQYIAAYLQYCHPLLPEAGVNSVTEHLLSEETLSHIAFNLGLKDLILTKEFPPSKQTLSRTFKAIVGALYNDQGLHRAELFVQDFILTQLVGKTIPDIWIIKNPMGLLTEILEKHQKGLPEPRLLWASGSETILATYMVGIYSDKELIGQSAGESMTIAEEMAARDALNRIFKSTLGSKPLAFGKKGHVLQLNINYRGLPQSHTKANETLKQAQ